MSKYLLPWILLAGVLPPTALPAAEPPRLSLTAAVARALAQYPAVAAATARSEEAQAAAGELGAARLPTLKALAAATQYEKNMVAAPIHGFGEGRTPPFDDLLFQGGVNLSYLAFDGGARRGRIRSAEADAAATRAAQVSTAQGVANRVVSAYVEILGQQEILTAHDHRMVSLESEAARARCLLDVGRAARVDILRVEAALASAEADRTRTALTLDQAERDLAALIGASVEGARAAHLLPLAPAPVPFPSRAPLVQQALQASPLVEETRRRQEEAAAAVQVAKSARLPEARVIGNYLAFGGGSTSLEAEWNASVQISVPIFDGGATGRAIARADAARRAASEQLRQAQLDATTHVDRALAALQDAQARSASLAIAVARLEEVVRIQKLLLETGQGTQTDYLNAEADLLTARANLTRARLGEIEARAGLARAAGQLTPEWIKENLEKRS